MDQTPPSQLRATFLGVSTILFNDGHDSLLIDGFFSRPSFFSTFVWRIDCKEKVVARCLMKAGIDDRLQAVLVAHSHFDHALDAPSVCRRTGAKLVGSESTRMIGKGYGLSDDQIAVVNDGEVMQLGAFRVTFFEGLHSPGDIAPGEINGPLSTPCSYKEFRTGKCYSYLIEHGNQRVFVHPSANYVPNKFHALNVSTTFLGVGAVGKQSDSFREEYWKEVVEMMKPTRIVPIHWDNFFISLESPLSAMPWIMDRWTVTERWLREKCESGGIELHVQQAWEVIDLVD
jgi:L-ascorbate metabolism protein UlaG (beta-lactamase superfamily)